MCDFGHAVRLYIDPQREHLLTVRSFVPFPSYVYMFMRSFLPKEEVKGDKEKEEANLEPNLERRPCLELSDSVPTGSNSLALVMSPQRDVQLDREIQCVYTRE